MQLPMCWYQSEKSDLEMVNVCTAKQMMKWFCHHVDEAAYLRVIRLVKSEEREAILVVPKKTKVGQCGEDISFRYAYMH